MEFCSRPGPPLDSNGVPINPTFLTCFDDDPLCDFGATPGDTTCTFRIALCFDITDRRIPCKSTGMVERVHLNSPREERPATTTDVSNRDALEAVLEALGGVLGGHCGNRGSLGNSCIQSSDCDTAPGRGNGKCVGRDVVFNPPLTTPNVCSGFAEIKVPLRRGRGTARKLLRIRMTPPKDAVTNLRPPQDGDRLQLVCKPHP